MTAAVHVLAGLAAAVTFYLVMTALLTMRRPGNMPGPTAR